MVKAVWNDVVIAETDNTVVVEGNHYFPMDSVNETYFKASQQTSVCPWKGVAKYYDIEVDGKVNKAAAWAYPDPSSAAKSIKGRVAFWHGVRVIDEGKGAQGGLLQRIQQLFSG